MIRLSAPELGAAELEAVSRTFRSGYLVQGEGVREFERQIAEYVGVRHAVAVNSGTAALHLALVALGVGPGDEVIVPDFTFPASANAVELAGAKPVLVDIDLDTYNLDPTCLEAALTPRTRAIMPVHLFGLSADMDPICEVAQQAGLAIVEDAACALGAEYRGRRCGALGDIACFSFHPRKVITTGEGGMVTTDDDIVADRLRLLRNHGIATRGTRIVFELAGFNCRLTDFQGAMGVVQMTRLESIIRRRAELAARYDAKLESVDSIVRPSTPAGLRHSWQSYVIRLSPDLPNRDVIIAALREKEVEATIGTHAVSAQPHYERSCGVAAQSLVAYERTISLPLHSLLSDADVDAVVERLYGTLKS